LAIAITAVGETIDRCEYYAELNIATPRGQMMADFEKYQNAARQGAAKAIGLR
jgi:hypothetical protein